MLTHPTMLSGFVRTDQSDVLFFSTSPCKELRQGVPGRRQQRGQRRRRRQRGVGDVGAEHQHHGLVRRRALLGHFPLSFPAAHVARPNTIMITSRSRRRPRAPWARSAPWARPARRRAWCRRPCLWPRRGRRRRAVVALGGGAARAQAHPFGARAAAGGLAPRAPAMLRGATARGQRLPGVRSALRRRQRPRPRGHAPRHRPGRGFTAARVNRAEPACAQSTAPRRRGGAAAAAATAACMCWATLSRRRAGGKWEGSSLSRGRRFCLALNAGIMGGNHDFRRF